MVELGKCNMALALGSEIAKLVAMLKYLNSPRNFRGLLYYSYA